MPHQWDDDDELVSWRSLDTTRGLESEDPPEAHAVAEGWGTMDWDDGEGNHLGLLDRRLLGIGVGKRRMLSMADFGCALTPPTEVNQAWAPGAPESPLPPTIAWERPGELKHHDAGGRLHIVVDHVPEQRELPSSSEMVSIFEPVAKAVGQRDASPVWDPRRPRAILQDPDRLDVSLQFNRTAFHDNTDDECSPVGRRDVSPPSHHIPRPEAVRASRTLGDFVAQKKSLQCQPQVLLPPHCENTRVRPSTATTVSLTELKRLEERCIELSENEQRSQDVMTKQLHELERQAEKLEYQEAQIRRIQQESEDWKEKYTMLERQYTQLQTTARDRDSAIENNAQLLQQKAKESTVLENKVQSLQTANESYQDQARKAIEEKDRVHKDYVQVVHELGKLQKQMNAAVKETVSIAEKDLLLREIEQLRREKEQLHEKMKSNEAKKSAFAQNGSIEESQRVKELVNRVRELEDEVRISRSIRECSGSADFAQSGAPTKPYHSNFSNLSHNQHLMPSMQSLHQDINKASLPFSTESVEPWSTSGPHIPSLLGTLPSERQALPDKPKSLKDLLLQKRAQTTNESQRSASLASLAHTNPALAQTSPPRFDFEKFKADALTRRSHTSSIGELLRFDPISDPSPMMRPDTPSVDTAISAPYATEKQTLLQDALQKRDLEQKLMRLHVDKEQTEAKIAKVEQTGLKTMSSRTEKAWLENRLRELTLEISRIKLSMR